LPQQASQTILPADASNDKPTGPSPTAITAPVLTLDSTTTTPNPSNIYIISSQTLFPGGPAITIGSTAYSLATSTIAVVRPSQTSPLVPGVSLSAAEPPQITIDSAIITANPDSGFVYASQTISAGESGIIVEGITYSIATSGSSIAIVENGVTSPLVTYSTSEAQVTQSIPVVHIVASAVVSGDTVQATISSPSILSSTPLIAENGGTPTASPIVKISASALIATPASPVISIITNTLAPAITIDSSTITQNSASEFIIGSQTLTPGGPAITLQSTTYSLASSTSALIINDHTTLLSATPTTVTLIAGTTLAPGVAEEVHGSTYSLASSGNVVVIDGTTKGLATIRVTSTVTPVSVLGTVSVGSGGVFTVGGRTYTIQTSATPGSIPASTIVVVDGETTVLSAVHTGGSGTGDAVASGLQISTTASSTSTLLDGSKVPGSGITSTATTSTGSLGTGAETGITSVATASAAGVQKAVQRGMWDVVGAAVIGAFIIF
jgi:hypothetical protein